MAGGRGRLLCGRDGCGGAAAGAGAAAGHAWLPQARWLARRLAALLVLLALVAAGCVLRRRACPAPRRRRPPSALRRPPLGPRPCPVSPPEALPDLGGPAAPSGPGLELPPLPRYEEVKHLPSYEEAQRFPRLSLGAGDGAGAEDCCG